MTPQPNKKAVLRDKYPRVFQGLGKLKGFQLKLHKGVLKGNLNLGLRAKSSI